jgi:hypothetical protein
MKKVLIGTVVLLALVYAGFKGYVYYKVSHILAEIAAPLAPLARLEYGWVKSSLNGAVGIEDVRLVVISTGDVIRMDSVELRAASLKDLLGIADNKRKQEFPKVLDFSVRGMLIDTTSAWFQKLAQEIDNDVAQSKSAIHWCDDINYFGVSQYPVLGYKQFSLDFSTGFRLSEEDSRLSVMVKTFIDGMQQMELTTDYDVAEIMDNPALALKRRSPKIVAVSLELEDFDYTQKFMHHCMESNNKSLAEQVETQVGDIQWLVKKDLGIVLNEENVLALKRFYREPKRLTLSINPPNALDFSDLAFYDAKDVPALLNLKIVASQ